MSSNKFLQRFEGKIQVVGKEGVKNVFGAKGENVVVYTNHNFNPQPHRTATSLNKPKAPLQEPTPDNKNSHKKMPSNKEKVESKKVLPLPPKQKTAENPFLISNPFYLDEDDKVKMQNERKERQLRERELQKQIQLQGKDSKKTTTVSLNRSLDKKRNQKEWTKLGGLGANIGGEDWIEKKKKLDKMQQFSEQVKMINKDKPKVPKPQRRQEKKEANPRQKALQYSKNVPKPVVRSVAQKIEEPEIRQQEVQNELSQLQQYEMRHEQLKNMLRNQL